MTDLDARALVEDGPTPVVLVAVGSLLALSIFAEMIALAVRGAPLLSRGAYVVGVATSLPFALGVAYGGYWLVATDVSPARHRRVGLWSFGVGSSFVAVNAVFMQFLPTGSGAADAAWLRWAACFGVGTGYLVGVLEARAIDRALSTERARMRAEHLEEQRDVLDYLNSVLRHEVLNTANVIDGYVSLLLAEGDHDDRTRDYLERIGRQNRDMTGVIEDIQVLLHATGHGESFAARNLADVVRSEIRKLRDRHDDVVVEASIPEEAYVEADEPVARVFGNLLANAVEHNDAEPPRVDVDVEAGADTVTVAVSDDGPGVPEAERESLFERSETDSDGHGLGLYIVAQLVDRYDGSVDLVETGGDGSTFAVTLPAATARDAASETE